MTDLEVETRETRVSTVELFFDLVFVFTITQVAVTIEHHPSWENTARAFVELVVVYWMYGGYAWLANRLARDPLRQRVVLLVGMALFFVVSLAVPRAFEGDGLVFAVAYLGLTLAHLVSFLLVGGRDVAGAMLRIGAGNLSAGFLLLVAGFVAEPEARWPFWVAAVAVQWTVPLLTRQHRAFTLDAGHFAERHGLMILIVLGESLVSVAVAAEEESVGPGLVAGGLSGLLALTALWWLYFGGDDDAAAERFADLQAQERGRLALLGYDVPHILMMAGVVFVAAGTRLDLPDLTEPATRAAALLIAGGAAMYVVGEAAFRRVLAFARAGPRAAVGALLLLTVPVGTTLGAAEQLLGVALVVIALLVVEHAVRRTPVGVS